MVENYNAANNDCFHKKIRRFYAREAQHRVEYREQSYDLVSYSL